MGNSICASSRKCQDNGEMFGMLCKRPYDKPVLVKFEKKNQERNIINNQLNIFILI